LHRAVRHAAHHDIIDVSPVQARGFEITDKHGGYDLLFVASTYFPIQKVA
jgi:hypothetical protein